MASRYSAPTCKSRARHTSPPGKRGEAGLQMAGNRWLPPPAPVSAFRPGGQHSARSRTSSAKSNHPAWQVPPRPNPSSSKYPKNALIHSDTTDPIIPAKLTNCCFCSMDDTFFKGIRPVRCVTHIPGQRVTHVLGSCQRRISAIRTQREWSAGTFSPAQRRFCVQFSGADVHSGSAAGSPRWSKPVRQR